MNDTALGFEVTTLEAAMAQANATYLALAMQVNNARADKYHADFAAWLDRIKANLTNEAAPGVPNGVVVAQGSDPTSPNAKWPYLAESGSPVCDPLPLPQDVVLHLSNTAKVGNKIGFTNPPLWQSLDTLPQTDVAVPAVSADGVSGWWRKVVQFGNLGHYEKVG